ncbi:MAG: phage terminase small subunit P27 family [Aeromonas sp.]
MAIAPGRGRRPKPAAIKRLSGNPGKRPLNLAEPAFSPILGAACPDWLIGDDLARGLWEATAIELCSAGVLCATDLHNLEAFCAAYSRWRQAEVAICKFGIVVESAMGSPMKNPACTVAAESLKQLASFGALLGLDPSSRTRLVGGRNKDNINPFADL